MSTKNQTPPTVTNDDAVRHSGTVHVGEAAARILERLKRSASQLSDTEGLQYDCEKCRDTGLIPGKQGAKRCPHIERKRDEEKFF